MNLLKSLKERIKFENSVASELIKIIEPPHSIHYWRTTQKAEVDFIIRKADNEIIPIEVKTRSISKIEISRSFRAFLNKYKPNKAFLFNYNLRKKQTVNPLEKISFLTG